jgi:hypothetical protein
LNPHFSIFLYGKTWIGLLTELEKTLKLFLHIVFRVFEKLRIRRAFLGGHCIYGEIFFLTGRIMKENARARGIGEPKTWINRRRTPAVLCLGWLEAL